MKNFNIWEGVYSSFKEAPACGKGFDQEDIFLAKVKKFREEVGKIKKKKIIPEVLSYGESLLPLLTGILAQSGKTIRILDFGGGFGETYLKTKSALPDNVKIEYVIVDLKKTCQEGRKILKNSRDLRYVTTIPDKFHADIVHIGSALQFIDSWKQVLNKLSDLLSGGGYFVFTDLTAGGNPMYVTTQYYYGSKMAVWFFNINDFLKQMNLLGYQLLFKSTFNAKILGKFQHYPQDNFDPKYRMGKSSNLVFRKKGKNLKGIM